MEQWTAWFHMTLSGVPDNMLHEILNGDGAALKPQGCLGLLKAQLADMQASGLHVELHGNLPS